MNAVIESPFAARESAVAPHDSAGSRQNQSRELAETQTKYLMAERFPRDEVAAMDRILNAFSRPTLAEKAAYQFARGGSDIAGPSIRAAEAMEVFQHLEHADMGSAAGTAPRQHQTDLR